MKPRAAGSAVAAASLIIALALFHAPPPGAAAPSEATAPPEATAPTKETAPSEAAAPAAPKRLPARISRVFDGYSFQVGDGLRGALIGVSAPANNAKGGKESFSFLKKLLEGNRVQLEVDEKLVDAYGQARYYVYLDDGTLVNELVLLRGYARAVITHPNVRHREKLLEAEKLAKTFRRGIWGDEFPDPKKADKFEDPPFRRDPPLLPLPRRRRY